MVRVVRTGLFPSRRSRSIRRPLVRRQPFTRWNCEAISRSTLRLHGIEPTVGVKESGYPFLLLKRLDDSIQ